MRGILSAVLLMLIKRTDSLLLEDILWIIPTFQHTFIEDVLKSWGPITPKNRPLNLRLDILVLPHEAMLPSIAEGVVEALSYDSMGIGHTIVLWTGVTLRDERHT